LAAEIARRWIRTNLGSFARIGALQEKYDIETSAPKEAGGGEYAVQGGVGWANGGLVKLMSEYPDR